MLNEDLKDDARCSDTSAAGLSLSVIIPTYNGAQQLRELLASFTIQTVTPDQILIVDSSSTDGTRKVAEKYNAEVIVIDRETFDHGSTRSMAAKKARGEILIYFTQDVLPVHRRVIENLVRPIIDSDDIAVSYGRQLPAFNASEAAAHLRYFNYPEDSSIRSYADRKVSGLKTVFVSNSCAAYRKTQLADINYFRNDLIFGEDTCAVGRLLERGRKIAYAADAAVYHSHNYSWSEEFRRYFDIGVLHASEKWLLKTYGSAQTRGSEYVRSGISFLCKRRKYGLISDFVVRIVLKYLGYRLGLHYRRIPRKMIPNLSMHKRWWNGKELV
jgi:rhamnosyltransferase